MLFCCPILKSCVDHCLTDLAPVEVESLLVSVYQVEVAHAQAQRIALSHVWHSCDPMEIPLLSLRICRETAVKHLYVLHHVTGWCLVLFPHRVHAMTLTSLESRTFICSKQHQQQQKQCRMYKDSIRDHSSDQRLLSWTSDIWPWAYKIIFFLAWMWYSKLDIDLALSLLNNNNNNNFKNVIYKICCY